MFANNASQLICTMYFVDYEDVTVRDLPGKYGLLHSKPLATKQVGARMMVVGS